MAESTFCQLHLVCQLFSFLASLLALTHAFVTSEFDYYNELQVGLPLQTTQTLTGSQCSNLCIVNDQPLETYFAHLKTLPLCFQVQGAGFDLKCPSWFRTHRSIFPHVSTVVLNCDLLKVALLAYISICASNVIVPNLWNRLLRMYEEYHHQNSSKGVITNPGFQTNQWILIQLYKLSHGIVDQNST